jgi:hypothetical protein
MKARSVLVFSLIAALSAGCSSVRVIDHAGGQNYYDGAIEYATLDGTIKTFVVGSPFGAANTDFARSVTSAMKGATLGRHVTFVPAPRNSEKNAFHIAVVFNGVNPFTVEDICENTSEIASRPNTPTTSMHAVFARVAAPSAIPAATWTALPDRQTRNTTHWSRKLRWS